VLDLLPQLLVNGIVSGTLLAIPAIGFTAIYAVLRFPNFSVASHATIGAFAGYVANVQFGLPAVVALGFAFAVAGLCAGWLLPLANVASAELSDAATASPLQLLPWATLALMVPLPTRIGATLAIAATLVLSYLGGEPTHWRNRTRGDRQ